MITDLRMRAICLIACIALLFGMGAKLRPELREQAASKGRNPASYLAQKAASHRLILLGTRHENKQANGLIIDILPGLAREAGITVLFVEIPSSQQDIIERFRKGLSPAHDIRIHEIIGSQDYLNIIVRAQSLGLDIIAIDHDGSAPMTRDQWMASRVSNYLALHPGSKGLVVVGNSHVYRNVCWERDGHLSLADHLHPLRPFSVVMWPGALETEVPKALDIDYHTFSGVKDPTLTCMSIGPQTCLATTVDGVILLAAPR